MFYVHRMLVELLYGGPEEGGWWYDQAYPLGLVDYDYVPPMEFQTEEEAFDACRLLNGMEHTRRELECHYEYTSVLAFREDAFYVYRVTERPVAVRDPFTRPHYE